jgi:hypothetical protein
MQRGPRFEQGTAIELRTLKGVLTLTVRLCQIVHMQFATPETDTRVD